MLCSINHEEPDHVPLYLRVCDRGYFLDKSQPWRNQFERVNQALGFGLDDTVGFVPELRLNEDVKIRRTVKKVPGEERPVLVKEYETPKGTLRQVVRQTRDWVHGDDIPIFSDYNVPQARSIEYLIKTERDLDALRCIFREPDNKQIEDLDERAMRVKEFAEKRQVLIECGGVGGSYGDLAIGGDAAVWLCGVRGVMVEARRDPEFIRRLLEIIHGWDMARIRAVLKVGGVDVIGHRGWYEGAFFSPMLFEKFIAPLLREEVEAAHRAGMKFGYIITRGLMPLLEDIKELGIDLIWGIDPVQDAVDLNLVKREVGKGICLWGGVNSYVTLQGGEGEIEKAVHNAIQALALDGGFILSAVDAVLEEIPIEGLRNMITAWKEYADYPVPTNP